MKAVVIARKESEGGLGATGLGLAAPFLVGEVRVHGETACFPLRFPVEGGTTRWCGDQSLKNGGRMPDTIERESARLLVVGTWNRVRGETAEIYGKELSPADERGHLQ